MKLKPKKWETFQHYKDRNPPWIKLHKELLDDFDWWCLPVASRALAPCLWLLASRYEDGIFDATPERLAFQFRMTVKDVIDAINPLIEKKYFDVASDVLADCKQLAMPETETETEEETEIEKIVSYFVEHRKEIKKPMTDRAVALFRSKLISLSKSGHDIQQLVSDAVINKWQTVYPQEVKPQSSQWENAI